MLNMRIRVAGYVTTLFKCRDYTGQILKGSGDGVNN
jgi:hypothetical protein